MEQLFQKSTVALAVTGRLNKMERSPVPETTRSYLGIQFTKVVPNMSSIPPFSPDSPILAEMRAAMRHSYEREMDKIFGKALTIQPLKSCAHTEPLTHKMLVEAAAKFGEPVINNDFHVSLGEHAIHYNDLTLAKVHALIDTKGIA